MTGATLHARLLGEAMAGLPPAVRALHSRHGTFTGEITVRLAANPVLRVIAGLAGFPRAVEAAPFTFEAAPDGDGERWMRRIGGHVVHSRLWTERGLLAERLGPGTALCRLEPGPDGLSQRLDAFRLLGAPIPLALAPRVSTREGEDAGRYTFDIAVRLPGTATPLVHYHGWVLPD